MVYSKPYVLHWEMNDSVIRASFMHPDRKVISQARKELSKMEVLEVLSGNMNYLQWCIENVYGEMDSHLKERLPELRHLVLPERCLFLKRGWQIYPVLPM